MKMMKAIHVYHDQGAHVLDLPVPELEQGEVLVKVHYSGVNYKDALAVTGKGKILRHFPMTPGIDMSGEVVKTRPRKFKKGDEVLVTGCGMGERYNGAFAEYVKVPAEHVVTIPAGLTKRKSMILGTAGFTAAYAIHQMEKNGQHPEQGPIVVTGATGGVGSIAVNMLAGLGYEVIAITGKKTEKELWLKKLGAAEILDRTNVDYGSRPLESARWAGAIDTVGGDTLAGLLRRIKRGGNVACIGLAGGHELHTTVMPFILRGINLLGINSADCPMPLRKKLWQWLAGDLKPAGLESIYSGVLSLEEIPEFCEKMLAGKTSGRWLVRP